MAEYVEREALCRKVSAFASSVVFRGTALMITGRDSCNPAEWTRGYMQCMDDLVPIITGQPAADVAPVVHGRWVKPTKIGYRAFDIPHCSACDGVPCGVDENTKYCPNCGAKMDGGKSNAD